MILSALLVATTLLDFDDAADLALWRPVDDVVMGGVSRSSFEQAGAGIARTEVVPGREPGFARPVEMDDRVGQGRKFISLGAERPAQLTLQSRTRP